jgi:hypothetical protein
MGTLKAPKSNSETPRDLTNRCYPPYDFAQSSGFHGEARGQCNRTAADNSQ